MAGEVKRKKVLSGRQAALEGGSGAERAWRVAFARATRDMMDLPVDFVSLTSARLSLAELLDLPEDRALILMLEGPAEGLGLLILSPDLLSALIEVLTLGKCGTQTPDPRKPTRTDAAMISPLADLALSHLEEALAEESDLCWTSGFRYASFIEEARSLGLLLEDMAFRALTARLSLAQGARVGEMILVLPAEGLGRKARLKADVVPQSVARPAFAAALCARVEGAPCQLDAVLSHLSMPLAEVMDLSVDRVLALPTAALDKISLRGSDGRHLAEGQLGQHRGMRAIRVTSQTLGICPQPQAFAASSPGTVEQWAAGAQNPSPFGLDGFCATGTD